MGRSYSIIALPRACVQRIAHDAPGALAWQLTALTDWRQETDLAAPFGGKA